MAVVKYQEWTSGTYNWYSSNNSDTLGQIVNELKAWVTTINSNASQSGKQVAVLKDESSSTSSNYFGFTLECPLQLSTGSLYSHLHSSSTTNIAYRSGPTWADNGGNGGYGTFSGTYTSDTSISFKNTVTTNARFLITTSTVNGEEAFVLSWIMDGSATYNDVFSIAKDDTGEWFSYLIDSGSLNLIYYDNVLSTPAFKSVLNGNYSYFVYSGNTTNATPYIIIATASGTTNEPYRAFVTYKSNDFWLYRGTHVFGDFMVPDASVGWNGDRLIALDSDIYSPMVRYTPV